jgi:DNA-binding response OmpR family regulator
MLRSANCNPAGVTGFSASAGKWLSAHNPDAAIIDVKWQDKSCVELAKKLSAREIPFLAVSGYPADTPGVNRIFRPVPWLVIWPRRTN